MGIIDSYRIGLASGKDPAHGKRQICEIADEIRPSPPLDIFCEIAKAGTITQVKLRGKIQLTGSVESAPLT